MPRFAANLTMLYPEHDFLDRPGAAAADGFHGVECLFPYAFGVDALAACLRQHNQELVLFNAPPGDWDTGERGLAALPGREQEFRDSVDCALQAARQLRCQRVHVMAGVVPAQLEREQAWDCYRRNVAWAADQAVAVDVSVLIEPLNPRDVPGYLLTHQAQAHALCDDLQRPNLRVQMDLYHCQIVEGDLSHNLQRHLPKGTVGHIQIAGVPSRHEPDHGELHYPHLFALIDQLGYQGWIGCEYRPRLSGAGGTRAGLKWLQPWLERCA